MSGTATTAAEDERLVRLGASTAAIATHYDLPGDFYRLWLGPGLFYSCPLWDGSDPEDTLERAQQRKVDLYASQLLDGPRARVLDVGCGWGSALERMVTVHGCSQATGVTLSRTQVEHAQARRVPGVDVRLEHWARHHPVARYDAIICIEASEHFARDGLEGEAKVEVFRAFFQRCASWLRPGGRMGFQVICLDNVSDVASRPGRGPVSELIRREIFPESMPAHLSEVVLAFETDFQLLRFENHTHQYGRAFREWSTRLRGAAAEAETLVGAEVVRRFQKYLAAGEMIFRLREHGLYRFILAPRREPKRWLSSPRPVPLAQPAVADDGATKGAAAIDEGSSPQAIAVHYDVSNDFYRLWLGPDMGYSCALWDDVLPGDSLERAQQRKIDFFAAEVLDAPNGCVLDIGCGWGATLDRLLRVHGCARGVGLTLSRVQAEHVRSRSVPGLEVRVEHWAHHRPERPYDGIVSFGMFEHVARNGLDGAQRVAAYRRFFERCFGWLDPDARLGLETIALDQAPETAGPGTRGPIGDHIMDRLFPEAIAPHLCEVVLGWEPYFEVKSLSAEDRAFARTFREWSQRLSEHRGQAEALVGADTVRSFRRYLAGTEVQFRLRECTMYRVVLVRRRAVKG